MSWATAGVDPAITGTGPIPASRRALQKAGWDLDTLDLIEANEAFAVQACAVNKDLGWDPSKVNVNRGAIALRHPIGASGARVLNTLLFEMQRPGRAMMLGAWRPCWTRARWRRASPGWRRPSRIPELGWPRRCAPGPGCWSLWA